MKLQAEPDGCDLIIRVQGDRIDAAGAVPFKDQILQLADGGTGRVVLDLSAVDFLDSSGLGALVAIRRMLGGRALDLMSPTPPVVRVLRLTRMDMVFGIQHAAGSLHGA
jgi:anti-sigma B factor antagonist